MPGGRQPAQRLPFLFGAKGASAGERIKQRHPFRCNETKTSPTVGRRSPWSPRRRHHRAFGRRRPTLVRISVPDVPLQIGQLLAPFPLNIWEEARGLCLHIGLATPRKEGGIEHLEQGEREREGEGQPNSP